MSKNPDYFFIRQHKYRSDKKTVNTNHSQTKSNYLPPGQILVESYSSKVLSKLHPIKRQARQTPGTHIIYDKELLYDELQAQKKIVNDQQDMIRFLKTSNAYLKNELSKLTIEAPQAEDQMKTSMRLRNDQTLRLQRELLARDKQIEQLKKESRQVRVEELEKQVKEQEALIEELQLKIQRCFELDQGDLKSLKLDNVELTYLTRQQELMILELKAKLAEEQRNFQGMQFKYKGLKQLQSQQYKELLLIKERDTLFQQHQQSRNADERNARQQLEELKDEMNHVNATLTMTQSKLQMCEKRLKDTQMEAAERIQMLEIEVSRQKLQLSQLREDLEIERNNVAHKSVQLLRRSVMMNSYVANPEDQLRIQKQVQQMNGSVQPDHVREEEYNFNKRSTNQNLHEIAREIKFSLIHRRIDLKEIDDGQYLFNEENKRTDKVFYGDVRVALQDEVFGLHSEQQWTNMAKYLTDFDDNAAYVSMARCRSIFKTLMENYSLPDEQEIIEIEQVLSADFQHRRFEYLDYVRKKQTQQRDKWPLEDLLESFKAFDAPFTQLHINHLIAKIYGKHGSIKDFEEHDLEELFIVQPAIKIHDDESIAMPMKDIDMSDNLSGKQLNPEEIKQHNVGNPLESRIDESEDSNSQIDGDYVPNPFNDTDQEDMFKMVDSHDSQVL